MLDSKILHLSTNTGPWQRLLYCTVCKLWMFQCTNAKKLTPLNLTYQVLHNMPLSKVYNSFTLSSQHPVCEKFNFSSHLYSKKKSFLESVSTCYPQQIFERRCQGCHFSIKLPHFAKKLLSVDKCHLSLRSRYLKSNLFKTALHTYIVCCCSLFKHPPTAWFYNT